VSAALQPLLCVASLPPAVRVQLRSDFCPLRLELPLAPGGSELPAVLTRRDVQRGVYEGGFKLWECAVDLIDFLSSSPSPLQPPSFRSVLELGCGAGFPGLYCLLRGRSSSPPLPPSEQPCVTFQDLNWEVLQHLTAPTIAANLQQQHNSSSSSSSPAQHAAASSSSSSSSSAAPLLSPSQLLSLVSSRCSFISGDWRHPSLLSLLPAASFSLILSSDTLYDADSIPALLTVVRHCLQPGGVALIASKRFYFGVGGGSGALAGQTETYGLTCCTERVLEDGRSNIREILSITHSGKANVGRNRVCE
jgi:protein-histidine N-methyltransferase